MNTVGEARFAISSRIDNEYNITTTNLMLCPHEIDDYVHSLKRLKLFFKIGKNEDV